MISSTLIPSLGTKCLEGMQLDINTKSILRWGNVMWRTSAMEDAGMHANMGVSFGLRLPGATPRGTATTFNDRGTSGLFSRLRTNPPILPVEPITSPPEYRRSWIFRQHWLGRSAQCLTLSGSAVDHAVTATERARSRSAKVIAFMEKSDAMRPTPGARRQKLAGT